MGGQFFVDGMTVRFNGTSISLDSCGGEIVFVSHAHGDHIKPMKSPCGVLCSDETYEIALARGVEPRCRRTSFKHVRMLEAGHVLGSKQIFIECDGESFVYTGDFKLEAGLTTSSAEVVECDTLIIDATYCNPKYEFPSRADVVREIQKWVQDEDGNIVLLGGYGFGKAQELIAILNDVGISPVVHPIVESICKVYEKFGISLDRTAIGTEEAKECMRDGFVAVMPQNLVNLSLSRKLSELYRRKAVCAVATGWASAFRFPVNRAFTLSDHGDFKQILHYIRESGAKKVYFTHFSDDGAGEALRRYGIEAQPLQR
ncbi:MAG: MBL fold metallo-hydrolase [Candidatus Micrarchaeia archaeon]